MRINELGDVYILIKSPSSNKYLFGMYFYIPLIFLIFFKKKKKQVGW